MIAIAKKIKILYLKNSSNANFIENKLEIQKIPWLNFSNNASCCILNKQTFMNNHRFLWFQTKNFKVAKTKLPMSLLWLMLQENINMQ